MKSKQLLSHPVSYLVVILSNHSQKRKDARRQNGENHSLTQKNDLCLINKKVLNQQKK